MNNALEILFDSKARPKILRYLFQNKEESLNLREIIIKCQVERAKAKSELKKFKKIKLILEKKQKGKVFFVIDQKFPFLNELRSLLLSIFPVSIKELKTLFAKIPQVKLLIASGIFTGEAKSPVDILIVFSRVQKPQISKLIRKIESIAGKEIRWCQISLDEFKYREEMRDKFLRDIFENRHQRVIDKLRLLNDSTISS